MLQLKERGEWGELQHIMAPRLEFGTAGIRGRMGPGFGQLNDLVIIQTTQVRLPADGPRLLRHIMELQWFYCVTTFFMSRCTQEPLLGFIIVGHNGS